MNMESDFSKLTPEAQRRILLETLELSIRFNFIAHLMKEINNALLKEQFELDQKNLKPDQHVIGIQ